VPVKLLKEGEGHVVTAELKSGEVYRGLLVESEDTMNVHLSDVTHTARNGKVRKLEQVYLRGSHLKFIVLPEILKNAPVFKKVQGMKRKETSKTAGRGRGGAFRGGKKRKTGQ
jgi:small nuclear ribonucleoprotein D3